MEGEQVLFCLAEEEGDTDGHMGNGTLGQLVSVAFTKLEIGKTEDIDVCYKTIQFIQSLHPFCKVAPDTMLGHKDSAMNSRKLTDGWTQTSAL